MLGLRNEEKSRGGESPDKILPISLVAMLLLVCRLNWKKAMYEKNLLGPVCLH